MIYDSQTRSIVAVLLMVILGPMIVGCQSNLRDENTRFRSQNRELQEQLDQTRAALEGCQHDRTSLIAEVERLQNTETVRANTGFENIAGIETIQHGGSIIVRVPGDILFSSGSVALKTSAKSTLDEIATVLNHEYATNTIRVEGYTDRDPIRRSKWQDNLELSAHRAMAVYRYLHRQGVDSNRMYAAGFGESNAHSTKTKSRRVEIVVVAES